MAQELDPPTEPLLMPVSPEHRAALELVGAAVTATGGWPIYQYVDAKIDDLNLDAATVLNSMPSIHGHGNLTYALVRRDRTDRDDELVRLTIAGLGARSLSPELPRTTETHKRDSSGEPADPVRVS